MLPQATRPVALPSEKACQPLCLYSSLTTRDFDELAGAFVRWRNRFRQLGRGPFRGELHLLQFGAIQIVRVIANQSLHAEGTLPAGCFACVPVLTSNEGAVWRGRRLKAGQTRVIVPGVEMDHVTAHDYEAIVLLVDGNLARESAAVLWGFDPEERLAGREAVTTDPSSVVALSSHMAALLDSAAAQAESLAPREAAHQLEEECARRFVGLLAGAEGDRFAVRSTNGVGLVRKAEEYVQACLAGPLSVLDLCRELGVSERTLHYAFQEVRGLSPMAYVKAKRLNAVRQQLKAGAGATVHEIARNWGFWHTGEFAAAYRRQFGELPSQTWRRS